MAKGNGDGLSSVGGTKAGKDVCQMEFDAVGADSELFGDVLVGESPGEGVENFYLAWCEFGEVSLFFQKLCRIGGNVGGSLAADVFDGGKEFVSGGGFDDDALCAGLTGGG